jgi:hypothetical protein
MGATDYLVMLAVPTLATGFLCGWLLGPRGWRTKDGVDKGGVALRMAVLATALGDYLVGVAMGMPSANGTDQLGQRLAQGLASAVVLWPIGLLLFGLIAMPITFAAGLLWAWMIGLLRRVAECAHGRPTLRRTAVEWASSWEHCACPLRSRFGFRPRIPSAPSRSSWSRPWLPGGSVDGGSGRGRRAPRPSATGSL